MSSEMHDANGWSIQLVSCMSWSSFLCLYYVKDLFERKSLELCNANGLAFSLFCICWNSYSCQYHVAYKSGKKSLETHHANGLAFALFCICWKFFFLVLCGA